MLVDNTASDDMPATPGAYDETFNGPNDGFVARIDFPEIDDDSEHDDSDDD